MREKEERIKEQRTVEAIKKGLMGANGKIGCVLKNLGQPIIGQGDGGFFTTSEFDFSSIYGEEEIEEGMPYYDEESFYTIGWLYDTTTRGKHLELKYLDNSKELTVFYKGYLVYKECAGELEIYVPKEEWESEIEDMYKAANTIRLKKAKEEKINNSKIAKNEKVKWLKEMQKKWGF